MGKRVLLQINECLNFSTGKIAQSIGEVANQQGWESLIAYSGRESIVTCKSKTVKIGSYLDSCLHFLKQRLFDNEGLNSSGPTRDLIKQIDTIKPDIIHLHNIHDHWLNYKLLFQYLNNTNIQVVWTFHDCWAFTGHCMHFVTVGCKRWKSGCYNCPMKGQYPKSFLDKSRRNWLLKRDLFAQNKNLHIVVVSNWLESFVKESFFKDHDIRVFHNGIDLDLFKPCSQKTYDVVNILGVSNVWSKEKGLYDFYKLRELFPVAKYIITLIGLTKKQIDKLPSGIEGIERTESVQDLVSLYSQANVLVNPTYADSFPTINIEALACGTPVVTYRTGGSPEIIDDQTGVVVGQGDLVGLVEAINKAIQIQPGICRIRAETCFNKNDRFEDYIQLYNELLEK